MAIKHTYKTKEGLKTSSITAMKAIRLKCLSCCCWFTPEIRDCQITDCPLWPFRMGKYPKNGDD